MSAPLRVAVLVDSARANRYLLDLLDWLRQAGDIEFVGVFRAQRGYPPKPRPGELDDTAPILTSKDGPRPRSGLGGPFARLFYAIDQQLAWLPPDADVMRGRRRVTTQPIPADGIACDLLIRAGTQEQAAWCAARGSRYGAIGLDFPIDQSSQRIAAGLDEASRATDETGFVLYRIEAAGPRVAGGAPPGLNRQSRVNPWPVNVIRHGWYPTRPSAAQNRLQLFGNALQVLKDAVSDCAAAHVAGIAPGQSPWPADPQAVHDAGRPVVPMLSPRRIGAPTLSRQLVHGFRALRRTARRLRVGLLGPRTGWSLGLARHGRLATVSVAGTRPVSPTGSHRYATPFVIRAPGEPDQVVAFVSDWDASNRRSQISALTLREAAGGGSAGASVVQSAPAATVVDHGPVLQAAHSLSFPFPFVCDGQIYLCPQAAGSGQITVYRAVDFPNRWEPAAVLMRGVDAGQTMLFEADGRWWLLTNLERSASGGLPGAGEPGAELHLFHAGHPLSSEWTPHPLNPLRIDARGARNAGLIVADDGIYRIGQIRRAGPPGHALAIYRITVLSTAAWREVLVRVIEPEHLTNLSAKSGIDTLSQAAGWTVLGIEHPGKLSRNEARIRPSASRRRITIIPV